MLTLFLYINSKKVFSQEGVTTWEDSWFIKKKKAHSLNTPAATP